MEQSFVKNCLKHVTNLIIISTIALLLHLAWEYLQCGPFFIHNNLKPTHFDMLKASLGDVVITLITYLIVSWLSKNIYWVTKPWDRWHWYVMLSMALIFSFAIELFAIRTNRWAYTEITPLAFGQISLLPVLQLLILFPVIFYLSNKMIKHNK